MLTVPNKNFADWERLCYFYRHCKFCKNYLMKKMIICLLLCCSFNLFAQDTPKDTIPPKPGVPAPKKDTVPVTRRDTTGAAARAAAPKKEEIKPYKEVITAEAATQRGLFWTHKVDKAWFFEIPDSLMNRDILVVTRYVSVPGGANVYGGEQANQQMVRFEKGPDKNIFLKLIATIAVADSTNQIYRAVELSNANPIIAAFPIKAIGNKTTVIDVTSYLSGDNAAVSVSQRIKKSLNLGGLMADRSFIQRVNSYPINVEVRSAKTFTVTTPPPSPVPVPSRTRTFGVADDAGVVTIEMNNSFLLLPKTPAQQRLFDPRVGFFADRYTKFSDDQQRADAKTFIVRWKLEPKPGDFNKWKNGQLVEPQKPIVFYIDPATPKQWVPYLIQGVNDWQKAFEKAGFKNAIYAKEWPKGDTTMSLEDARYSVIRYFASDIENAYGPNVHDPRSGQILESHIGWYHNVMKLLQNWYMIQAGPNDRRAQQMKFPDELMGELIRFVSSHEVGHTLGLRHNFGSSSTVPVEKLRDKKWVEANGHTPSIMDYARFNYVAQPEDKISEKGLFPRIGEYDDWAIQWGYSYSGASTPEEDKKITNKWIVNNLRKNPRLWFGTETNPWDPRSQSEAVGDNAMLASEYGLKNLKRVVEGIPKWTKEEADRYQNMGEIMQQVFTQYNRYMNHVLKYVGGIEETFKSVEEPGSVYVPTDKKLQRDAIAFLNKNLFQAPDWILNNEILDKTTNPAGEDLFARVQLNVLNNLLSGERLNILAVSEQRFGETVAFKMEDMMADVETGIWKELESGQAIPQYRRNLQKQYVTSLTRLTSPTHAASTPTSIPPFATNASFLNSDVSSVARGFLLRLKNKIDGRLNAFTDVRTQMHLQDVSDRIKQALDLK